MDPFATRCSKVSPNYGATSRPVWNPDMPEGFPFDNGFKIQWEMFLKHVAFDTPYEFTLLEGAKGVQLAELGIESWEKRAWVDVPKLEV